MPKIDVELSHSVHNDKTLHMRLPVSLGEFGPDLGEFLARMLLKLDKNSHKQTPTREDMASIVSKLRREVEEFEEQMAQDKTDENAGLELADIANFAFIAFVAWRAGGVKINEMVKTESDLPEFIFMHIPQSKRASYVVETPSVPMVPRYMYRRTNDKGVVVEFGPYLHLHDAVTYGSRAYAMKEGKGDV